MNIVICGAGQVGYHAAEVLVASGHRVTVIDSRSKPLREIQETLDAATLRGSCSQATVLKEAGVPGADLVVTATDRDEVNLLTASVAKGLGAKQCIARVRARGYFEDEGFDYVKHFGVDRIICPEYAAARAIARTLRSPGAMAIERFARGQIEMQELPVGRKSAAIGRPLSELRLPPRTRLAAIQRGSNVILPRADSVVERGDVVILLGARPHFSEALELFGAGASNDRQRVVLMGGTTMAVWLCRALRSKRFSIRIFETDSKRATQLADKLDWVTVMNADPTDPGVFQEESLEKADVFIALTDDDEHNILGSAWVKSMGVPNTIAVVQRPQYSHLLKHVGIDQAFSPRTTAVRDIVGLLERDGLRQVATLAEGVLDVFRAPVPERSKVAGRALRELGAQVQGVIAAVEREDTVFVPAADDTLEAGDAVLVVAPHGAEKRLASLFGVKALDTDYSFEIEGVHLTSHGLPAAPQAERAEEQTEEQQPEAPPVEQGSARSQPDSAETHTTSTPTGRNTT
jgi:trk system potassium uptake protein TrkA